MVGIGKAKEILRHGLVHGRPLTPKQKGLFGLVAGGRKPTRLKHNSPLRAGLSSRAKSY